ncbi:MAG TPA: hypothetical protein PKD21_12000 [Candidatus Competibacter phosphatis]|nr:hypothetical protein [Candidatus Competibacter phosphatis]
MAIPNDYKDIVETLYLATDEGRVKWTQARFGFEVTVQGSRFQIWSGTDEENGQAFVAFALADEKGKTLDSWYVDESESEFEWMHKLFYGAKRQALGISKILAGLKEVIGKGGVIGDEKPNDDDIPFQN